MMIHNARYEIDSIPVQYTCIDESEEAGGWVDYNNYVAGLNHLLHIKLGYILAQCLYATGAWFKPAT